MTNKEDKIKELAEDFAIKILGTDMLVRTMALFLAVKRFGVFPSVKTKELLVSADAYAKFISGSTPDDSVKESGTAL